MPSAKTKVLQSFETYRPIESYMRQLKQEEPSCFNGIVNVTRYHITVEEIIDPPEVLGARIQELWDHCENHHHWAPLKFAAKKIGLELKGAAGCKRSEKS